MVEPEGYIGMYIGALARGFEAEGKGGWLGVSKYTVLPLALSTAGSTVDCPKIVWPENGPDPWDWAEPVQSTRMPAIAKAERHLSKLLLRTIVVYLHICEIPRICWFVELLPSGNRRERNAWFPFAEFCVVGDFPGKQD